jgi:ADP-heptose:LPS heptosyltransferase
MNNRKLIRIATWGGMGDALLLTPSLRALKRSHPLCKIKLACSDKAYKDIFKNNPHIDGLTASRFSYILYKLLALRGKCIYPAYGAHRPSLTLGKHAADIVAEMLNVTLDDNRLELFLTKKEDGHARALLSRYANPIVIHIFSRCSANHLWPLENWEQLIRLLPGFTFIQLGASDEPRVKGAVDMLGKISVRAGMGIVKYSKCLVGVDSFWAHVASALDVPGVVLFGDSTPVVWGHESNLNIYKKVACSPCIDILFGQKCPYGNKCMNTITVDEVSAAIMTQMQRG